MKGIAHTSSTHITPTTHQKTSSASVTIVVTSLTLYLYYTTWELICQYLLGKIIIYFFSNFPLDKMRGMCYNENERPGRLWRARQKPPLPGGFNPSLPHASAILRFPTLGLTNLCEVLGDSSAILLGLSVADFIEVHHSYHFLSFFVS